MKDSTGWRATRIAALFCGLLAVAAAAAAVTRGTAQEAVPEAVVIQPPQPAAIAADDETTDLAEEVAASTHEVGPVTGLPLPRFVSMKAMEGNVRRGPSLSHRIDWVYHRKDLPLLITAEHGHWRRVQDHDGAGGWVHYSLLSGVRTVLLEKEAAMRMKPADTAPANAMAQPGVVARLDECLPDWCWIRAGGYAGWTAKSALWGVGRDEVID